MSQGFVEEGQKAGEAGHSKGLHVGLNLPLIVDELERITETL